MWLLEGDPTPDFFSIVYDFKLYFAVHTKDGGPDANNIYTQRASAFWHWNGSGTVDENRVWTASTTDAERTGGDAHFTLVSGGAVVPVTTGLAFNTIAASSTWITFPG